MVGQSDRSSRPSLGCLPRTFAAWEWDYLDGLRKRQPLVLRGHQAAIRQTACAAAAGIVASGDRDGVVRIWELRTGNEKTTINAQPDGVTGVALDPDGKYLAVAGKTHIKLFDVESSDELWRVPGCAWVMYHPDQKYIIAAQESDVVFYDARTGDEVRRLVGHQQTVHCAALGPDRRRLATCATDQAIRIWELDTGESRIVPQRNPAAVQEMRFRPDGTHLFVSTPGAINTINLETGETSRVAELARRPHPLDISPDGRWLAYPTGDGTVRIFDPKARNKKCLPSADMSR